jgi:septum formation protein
MTTLWLTLQKHLVLVHMFVSLLGTTFKSSTLTISFISISAFTVQQQHQQRNHNFKSVVARQSSTLLEHSSCLPAFYRCRYFWTPTPSTTKIMIHSTQKEECIDGSDTQLQRRRPELVLSLKDYIQEYNAATNSDRNDSEDSTAKIKLVLASASPRRREILDMMGLQNRYEVIPSPLDETQLQNKLRSSDHLDPYLYTRTLAEQKAYAVAYAMLSQQSVSSERNQRLILGSDTVVAITDDGTNVSTVLEKPVDTNDAIRMLQQLQNRTHIVYTGVAIVRFTPLVSTIDSASTIPKDVTDAVHDGYYRDNPIYAIQLVQSFVETAIVHISALNDIDIKSYVATNEPMDKAGAYGIQGIGGQIVTKVDGDFFTVRTPSFVVGYY